MKRTPFVYAGTGIAAAGLVVLTAFGFQKESKSLYKPSGEIEINLGEEGEENASGAIQWRLNRLKNVNTGVVEYADLLAAQIAAKNSIQSARQSQPVSTASVAWNELGPDNVGGRTRALLIDQNNSNHMIAGGVGGGLWESFDGANNWQRVAGFFNVPGVNINICCIAQGPDGTIYAGTGETSFYFDFGTGAGGFPGDGIYKSSDGGVTWSQIPATAPTIQGDPSQVWAAVNRIAVDPTNALHIYAATNRGLKITTDGGATWTSPTSMANLTSTDVEVASGGRVMATYGHRPYLSTDYGATWTAVGASTNGFSATTPARTELAIAPSDPNYVYAFCAGSSSTGNQMLGVWVSIDGGSSWTQVCGAGNAQFDPFNQSQGVYDNIVSVDPTNPQRAVFAGVECWEWTMITTNPPAGQWNRISLEFPDSPFNPYYVHSDKHAIVWHPTQTGTFYIGCDGGVFRTTNYHTNSNPPMWTAMNSGYNVMQCYSIAFDHENLDRSIAVAGTQDNGTQFIDHQGNTMMSATEIQGGDGAQCEMSFLNTDGIFTSTYYGEVHRSSNYGSTGSQFYDTRITGLANYGNAGFANFVTPIRLWESVNDVLSGDSSVIANTKTTLVITTTSSSVLTYSGYLYNPTITSNPAPTIVLDSVKFLVGTSISLESDALGDIADPLLDTGWVNATTGQWYLQFNSAPPNNQLLRATFDTRYNVGTTFSVPSNIQGRSLQYVNSAIINPNDTVLVQDVIQSRLAVGFSGNNGIWITRRPIDFSASPEWIKIGGTNSTPFAYGGEAQCMAWSPDGDKLYVGTSGGVLYRFDNLGSVLDSANGDVDNASAANPTCIVRCYRLASQSGRAITGIDVDPNNPAHVVYSLGGLGATNYVYVSSQADTATSSTTAGFFDRTGSLDNVGGIPTYCVTFDKYVANRILVGTEHGVFESLNTNVGSPTWTAAMSGLDNVTVDAIRQQRWDPWLVPNAGCFYLGTHGRGMWRDDSSWQQPTGVDNPSAPGTNHTSISNSLLVFPNPVADKASVSFTLANGGNATVKIYDLNGKMVYSQEYQHLGAGSNTVQFDAAEFAKGTYLIAVTQGAKRVGTGKFIKMN
jgi:hypothetical protein